MAESDTSKYIKDKVSGKIKANQEQIEFFTERTTVLDNEKIPLDTAIKSVDKVVLDQIIEVNTKLNDVKTAYQNRVDAGTCRTDLFWRRTGIGTVAGGGGSGYYIRHTYQCQRTVATGYATTVAYISSAPDGVSISPAGLLGYVSKNLYGIRYYYEPYCEDVIDSFVSGFIGTVGAGSSVVTALVSVDSGALSGISVGQLLVCEKDGVFVIENNEIVGIGTTVADLSVINSGLSTESTVYTFTVESGALSEVSAPESDGSFVEFQVLKSASQVGNLSLAFGTNPYSPQSIGIMKSSELGKGVKVEFTNQGWPSATQSWRPELESAGLSSKPQVSAGKLYYNVGFTRKPQKFSGGSWVDADIGDVAYLYYPGDVVAPADTARVEDMGTCASEQSALDSAIDIADAAEAEISSGTSLITQRMNIATTLRKERNSINIQIWGNRQLIGKMNEEITDFNSVKTALNNNAVVGIIT